jgi:hemerythrin-like domain-containing protein
VTKRAEALRPLSREHLGALLAAKKLREAGDREQATRAFLDFWEKEGRHHFRIEEEVLLPGWSREAEVDRPGAIRMLEEHLAIRTAALRLATDGASPAELRELGELLHDHVRFEERSLFPRIEASLDAEALERLGARIEQAEAGLC